MRRSFFWARIAGALALAAATSALGSIITTDDIVAIPQHLAGSGNGTLDLRMFTHSGSEVPNAAGTFDGDNGNNALPQGSGSEIYSFAESYVTTIGKLKAYYDLNFSPGSVNNLVLYLDLNETGGGIPINTLEKLDIVLNPASIQGNPNPLAGDVSSAAQTAIGQLYSGGTIIARLDPQPAANLPLISQGAGFADYAIFTGIDPYSLNDSDVLLFNISMSDLNDGAEEVFLSGSYAPRDLVVPEPSSLGLLAGAALALALRRRARR